MKKILFLIITIVLIFASANNATALSSHSWHTPRNGNKQPVFSAEAVSVSEHGGYYMDTSLDDSSDEKILYLTFDFGYENGNVEKILDILHDENVPAAFFILDNPILKNTELVCRIADEGHLICNHTKNHKDLTCATEEDIEKNLTSLEKIYTQKTGKKMAKYFRFPEGKYSKESMDIIERLGYKTIFWSFAYDDWDNERQPSREGAMKKVLDNTHNGAVILLHPTSSVNADILPALIKEWRCLGYKFGTLDELVMNVDSNQ